MGDLLITPFFIIFFGLIAVLARPYVTTHLNRQYFLPGLYLKFLGAISLGLIYQFYYGGGDTFMYFNLGSRWVWEAFWDSPLLAFKLIFADGQVHPDIFQYTSRIYTYGDDASYFVVRIAGIFGIFTLNSYYGIAVCFAAVSFVGIWALYLGFYRLFPQLHREFAFSILFIPSLFFWGSGLLKDSLTIGSLGLMFFGVVEVIILRRFRMTAIMALTIGILVLIEVKLYIILCFLPAIFLWWFSQFLRRIKNPVFKALAFPFVAAMFGWFAFYSVNRLSEINPKYSIESLSATAEESARWLAYVGRTQGGSVYTLGDFDYSPSGLASKFVPAVIVSLYRPFLWEARNPVMLLSALENTFMIGLTLIILFRTKPFLLLRFIGNSPTVLMCLTFTVFFAFGIGVSTYNFGSLVRYKIPLIPFYLSALFIIRHYLLKSTTSYNARSVTAK